MSLLWFLFLLKGTLLISGHSIQVWYWQRQHHVQDCQHLTSELDLSGWWSVLCSPLLAERRKGGFEDNAYLCLQSVLGLEMGKSAPALVKWSGKLIPLLWGLLWAHLLSRPPLCWCCRFFSLLLLTEMRTLFKLLRTSVFMGTSLPNISETTCSYVVRAAEIIGM